MAAPGRPFHIYEIHRTRGHRLTGRSLTERRRPDALCGLVLRRPLAQVKRRAEGIVSHVQGCHLERTHPEVTAHTRHWRPVQDFEKHGPHSMAPATGRGPIFFNGLIAWHLGFVNFPLPATRREGLHPTQGPASSRGEILGNFPYLNQQRADGEFMQQKSLDEASVRRLILRVLHYRRYLVVGRLISRHPSRRAVLASS